MLLSSHWRANTLTMSNQSIADTSPDCIAEFGDVRKPCPGFCSTLLVHVSRDFDADPKAQNQDTGHICPQQWQQQILLRGEHRQIGTCQLLLEMINSDQLNSSHCSVMILLHSCLQVTWGFPEVSLSVVGHFTAPPGTWSGLFCWNDCIGASITAGTLRRCNVLKLDSRHSVTTSPVKSRSIFDWHLPIHVKDNVYATVPETFMKTLNKAEFCQLQEGLDQTYSIDDRCS